MHVSFEESGVELNIACALKNAPKTSLSIYTGAMSPIMSVALRYFSKNHCAQGGRWRRGVMYKASRPSRKEGEHFLWNYMLCLRALVLKYVWSILKIKIPFLVTHPNSRIYLW